MTGHEPVSLPSALACSGSRPAERDEREVAWVEALLHRDQAQRPEHVLVDDVDDAGRGGLDRVETRGVRDGLHGRARRVGVQGDLAAGERGREVAEHHVGVGDGRLGPPGGVRRRAGRRAGRLRADPQGLGERRDVRDGTAAGTDGADVDRRRPDLEVADRGLPADARGQVLDQRDVRRRAAHVEGEEVAVPGLGGHPRGTRHASRGAGQQQVDGVVGGHARRDEPAVAAEDRERAADARVPQLALEVGDVALDLWLHHGVGDGGDGPLVLPQLGQDRGGQRHGQIGELLRGDVADPLLVGGVGVGVDEADAQGLDAAAGQGPQLGADVVLVELGDHRAVTGDASPDLDGVLQRGEGLGLGPDDPARQAAGDERPRDLQHLAEPVGGHEADPGALALEDGVGRDRRPVEHVADRGALDARGGARLVDAAQHPHGLVLGRGGGLGAERRAGVLVDQQDVGERATHVDSEPVGHAALLDVGGAPQMTPSARRDDRSSSPRPSRPR